MWRRDTTRRVGRGCSGGSKEPKARKHENESDDYSPGWFVPGSMPRYARRRPGQSASQRLRWARARKSGDSRLRAPEWARGRRWGLGGRWVGQWLIRGKRVVDDGHERRLRPRPPWSVQALLGSWPIGHAGELARTDRAGAPGSGQRVSRRRTRSYGRAVWSLGPGRPGRSLHNLGARSADARGSLHTPVDADDCRRNPAVAKDLRRGDRVTG